MLRAPAEASDKDFVNNYHAGWHTHVMPHLMSGWPWA
jgi:hypothetical protein